MVTIQKATPADALLIADIGKQSFLDSHGHSGPAADIDAYVLMTYTLEAVQEELNDPNNIYHTICYDGKPAGYSKIILNNPHPLINAASVTKLERLYLLEQFYDLKLGMALFNFIVSLSKEKNQQGIWLYTWTKNERAINFYKKSGFKIIGNTDFKISATHSNPNYVMYLNY